MTVIEVGRDDDGGTVYDQFDVGDAFFGGDGHCDRPRVECGAATVEGSMFSLDGFVGVKGAGCMCAG